MRRRCCALALGSAALAFLMCCRFNSEGLAGLDAISDRSRNDRVGGEPRPDGAQLDGVRRDKTPLDETRADAPRPDSPRADVHPDRSPDAPVPRCNPGQVLCGSNCASASDCTGCSAGKLLCKATRACLASCATCSDLAGTPVPVECFACNSKQNNPIGTCEYNSPSAFCLSGDYSASYKGGAGQHCDCSNGSPANCAGSQHVCLAVGGKDWCVTCGEAGLATNGLTCKGGGKCNTALSPPRCQ